MKVMLTEAIVILLSAGVIGGFGIHDKQTQVRARDKWRDIARESVQLNNKMLDNLDDCVTLLEGTKK